MRLNIEYLERSIETLEGAFALLQQQQPGEITYNIYRAACVKEFEIIEEQCGYLLKRRIRPYFASNRAVDELVFPAIFRHAAKHTLISGDQCERWLQYRRCRNNSAHNYRQNYAQDVLAILPPFIDDAKALSRMLGEEWDDDGSN